MKDAFTYCWGQQLMNNDLTLFSRVKGLFWTAGALLATVLLCSWGTAIAQDDTKSASAEALLDEITVSARRREERLLDQPMSIAAFTSEQMQVLGFTASIRPANSYRT